MLRHVLSRSVVEVGLIVIVPLAIAIGVGAVAVHYTHGGVVITEHCVHGYVVITDGKEARQLFDGNGYGIHCTTGSVER